MNILFAVLGILGFLAFAFFFGAFILAWLMPLAFPGLAFAYGNGMAMMGLLMLVNFPSVVVSTLSNK